MQLFLMKMVLVFSVFLLAGCDFAFSTLEFYVTGGNAEIKGADISPDGMPFDSYAMNFARSVETSLSYQQGKSVIMVLEVVRNDIGKEVYSSLLLRSAFTKALKRYDLNVISSEAIEKELSVLRRKGISNYAAISHLVKKFKVTYMVVGVFLYKDDTDPNSEVAFEMKNINIESKQICGFLRIQRVAVPEIVFEGYNLDIRKTPLNIEKEEEYHDAGFLGIVPPS